MPKLSAWLLAFVATTQLTGFWCRQPEQPEPCEMDPLGCGEPETLTLDPSCTLSDPLVVELGEGESRFEAFGPLHTPTVNYGFQGGQHYYLGVRVDNPADDYPGLQIDFTVEGALDCPVDAATCEWTAQATRRAVVTSSALLKHDAAGGLVTTGYVVVLDEDPYSWSYGHVGRMRIRAELRDPCDRKGSAAFEYLASDGTGSGMTGGESTGASGSSSGAGSSSTGV